MLVVQDEYLLSANLKVQSLSTELSLPPWEERQCKGK